MKRVEYDLLAARGFFEDEKVELLFGMVVPMTPIDPAHRESVRRVHDMLLKQIGERARVYCQTSFAASDDSEPEPDVYVTPTAEYWTEHPSRSFLIVEVALSSLRRDRAKRLVYGRADVDEYWIVNHVDGCVEVFRDLRNGAWETLTKHERGETLSPLAFPDVKIPIDEILPPA
ncbi:MAG: Uma2 family endonuclease [Deltaproteobacteria bacterium]|nr:Uma2 family endonuclease [Deltaproteobacteria bacterium]MDQ3298211.1 Uma2 family endonuclease [Myxococcota bacterium]